MPTQSIIIRLANTKDLASIEDCAKQAYAKYVERMGQEPAPMQADFNQQIQSGIVCVAIKSAAVAGYVVFYPENDHMHLENIAVFPEQAGHGIGKKLVAHVEHQARKTAKKSVELYTNEAMVENFGLYIHLGYQEIERREESGFKRVFFSKTIGVSTCL